MNFIMANLVQEHGRPSLASPESRHEVMQTLRHIRRNRAQAQRAYRVCHGAIRSFCSRYDTMGPLIGHSIP